MKTVKADKYRVTTTMPANRQKLFKAGSLLMEPVKKAIAFVTDVMVIDGPACAMPIRNRSFAERCTGV